MKNSPSTWREEIWKLKGGEECGWHFNILQFMEALYLKRWNRKKWFVHRYNWKPRYSKISPSKWSCKLRLPFIVSEGAGHWSEVAPIFPNGWLFLYRILLSQVHPQFFCIMSDVIHGAKSFLSRTVWWWYLVWFYNVQMAHSTQSFGSRRI